jgi:DNA-binding MarR family transcriptional regulator
VLGRYRRHGELAYRAAIARALGITPIEASAVAYLLADSRSPEELAHELDLSSGGAVAVMHRLENRGYAARFADRDATSRLVLGPSRRLEERRAHVLGLLLTGSANIRPRNRPPSRRSSVTRRSSLRARQRRSRHAADGGPRAGQTLGKTSDGSYEPPGCPRLLASCEAERFQRISARRHQRRLRRSPYTSRRTASSVSAITVSCAKGPMTALRTTRRPTLRGPARCWLLAHAALPLRKSMCAAALMPSDRTAGLRLRRQPWPPRSSLAPVEPWIAPWSARCGLSARSLALLDRAGDSAGAPRRACRCPSPLLARG